MKGRVVEPQGGLEKKKRINGPQGRSQKKKGVVGPQGMLGKKQKTGNVDTCAESKKAAGVFGSTGFSIVPTRARPIAHPRIPLPSQWIHFTELGLE